MEGKSYLLCRFASGHLLLNEAMEGYILIVLQVLITGLIIWRRKQDSKEPLGCLAAGFIFMIVFVLTTVLFSLGHLIINEGLFANIFAESRGSLAAASPVEWLMAGFICLIMILVSATVCSLTGYAVTGRHPKFCKLIWKTLAVILLLPIVALGILVAAFGFAYIICMRFASPMFDDIGWGWMLLLLFFCVMCLLGFSGFVVYLLEMNGEKLKEYDEKDNRRSFRPVDMDNNEKGGTV